jgi:hypothetical protein
MATATITELEEPVDREAFLKLAKYPLIKHTDMLEEMRIEAVELCVSAIEKFPANLEKVRLRWPQHPQPLLAPTAVRLHPYCIPPLPSNYMRCVPNRVCRPTSAYGVVEGSVDSAAISVFGMAVVPAISHGACCDLCTHESSSTSRRALPRQGKIRSGSGEAGDATLTVEPRWRAHTGDADDKGGDGQEVWSAMARGNRRGLQL